MSDQQKFTIYKNLTEAQGSLNYVLYVFGSELAQKNGWRDLDGIDAVYFYLIKKHNWLPRDVRSMSQEDLHFVLTEELQGFKMPAAAC